MAAPLILKGIPLLRLRLQRYNRLFAGTFSSPRGPCCAASDQTGHQEEVSSAEKSSSVLTVRDPPKYHRWDDPDYRKWKDKEEEILRDIEPIISLVKEILHSDRYKDGERLIVSDEETVLEKLLRHHPHSEDKIGCGLDSIMVDRHPQFRHSRCLFVVRTDGGWIDFSYQKCLRAYIRDKYPSHAERFIREHFKRSSG
ncbi:F-box protein [Hibiscus syriacus]|uniref:F-box protein n=1 Tax=Hibiscus syriacus TaxID=106335 RepID=A0A6A3BQI2_HIBSY|nr:protein DCL homolog, chloroplastic-like [Hibiscus syriacus]KAE8718111.1 F-box protein [Hibiscus syriacus]